MKVNLSSRDVIVIAVFSIIYFIVLFFLATIIAFMPILYVFMIPFSAIPCGIVWVYLRNKVDKFGSISLQGLLFALLLLLMGAIWVFYISVLLGAIVADVLDSYGRDKYRIPSLIRNIINFSIFNIAVTIGNFLPIRLMTDFYLEDSISRGMDPAYMLDFVNIILGPLFWVSLVLCVAGSIVGAFVGQRVLRKHFQAAGVV